MKNIVLFVVIATLAFFAFSDLKAQVANITAVNATKDKGYVVLNQGEPITIYQYKHLAHSAKEAEKYGPKYYFTTGNSDVLQGLTKINLKKAYPNNHSFHDALDAQFKDDSELFMYDDFHKMYKINWLFKQNTK